MIVLDASVLIGYLETQDAHHARAEDLLAAEIEDDFAASVVTLAEVLVAPARSGRVAAVEAALSDLEVAELALPSDAARELAELRATSALKMPDCCVLLAALSHGARLGTFDARLGTAAAERGVTVLGG
ncbi:PIN domain-containing protein [uncultured Nocardioides sp.]|uniref:type II toxin-antitoxin system VapC family toxin n=1 Tax=uncultured Nocardioides sp. TaxID=198441 RepID=UPI0026261D9D|nr:PIN domain-containing protein [uncultured Nocardioides sp.]